MKLLLYAAANLAAFACFSLSQAAALPRIRVTIELKEKLESRGIASPSADSVVNSFESLISGHADDALRDVPEARGDVPSASAAPPLSMQLQSTVEGPSIQSLHPVLGFMQVTKPRTLRYLVTIPDEATARPAAEPSPASDQDAAISSSTASKDSSGSFYSPGSPSGLVSDDASSSVSGSKAARTESSPSLPERTVPIFEGTTSSAPLKAPRRNRSFLNKVWKQTPKQLDAARAWKRRNKDKISQYRLDNHKTIAEKKSAYNKKHKADHAAYMRDYRGREKDA